MDTPAVQQATGAVQARAEQLAHSAREIASDKGRGMSNRLSTMANDRLPSRLSERFAQREKPASDWAEYPPSPIRDGYVEE